MFKLILRIIVTLISYFKTLRISINTVFSLKPVLLYGHPVVLS